MRKPRGCVEGHRATLMSHTFFVHQSTGVCHNVCVCVSPALLSSFRCEHGNQLNTHSRVLLLFSCSHTYTHTLLMTLCSLCNTPTGVIRFVNTMALSHRTASATETPPHVCVDRDQNPHGLNAHATYLSY